MDAPGTTGTRLRCAAPGDEDLLTTWVCAVAHEAEGRHLDETIVREGLHEALSDPLHRRYYILEQDDVPVAGCMVTTEWSDWTARWYWWLQSIWVDPAHRGKGTLEALLEGVHDEAHRARVEKMLLYVYEGNNRAIRAYEKRGYEKADQFIYERRL